MATRTISKTDLVGLTSLSFIRPQNITFTVAGTKPSTRMYAFFDGISVNQYITPAGLSLGANIVTNAAGFVTGTFSIPPATFNTGNRTFRIQDTPSFDTNNIPGSTVGSASAVFSAAGLLQTYQETITNIETQVVRVTNTETKVVQVINNVVDAAPVPVPVPVQVPSLIFNNDNDRGGSDGGGTGDPLAQTFFTYGISGGCFITKIDVYFQSKDANIPVTIELRRVSNGYPSGQLVSPWSTVTLPPSAVNLSNNASWATTFTFSRPIYLEESKDYCFVLLANSNSYNMWTSKLGEKSIESGNTIFDQPFIGTLFKSENNITWTAEQTEDIKFTLYKASFDTVQKSITSKANARPTLIQGDNLAVTSGSGVVTMTLPFQHGHRTGDKIVLTGITGGNYRGVSSAIISNPVGFSLTVVSDYILTFNVGTNFTSTGRLVSSGILNSVIVDSSGSGYVSPSIVFSGGGGAGAAATANVVGGKIVSVTVTNPGTGYTSTPALVLSDAVGSGAVLVPISEAIFSSPINRKYQNVAPILSAHIPPGTSITNTLRTSSEDYVVGAHELHDINTAESVEKDAVLVNPVTESISFGANASTQMITRLSTNNSNVSPMIDIGQQPRLRAHNFLINDSSNSASELTPNSGTSYARYISKIISITTASRGIRVIVNAASVINTSFDVFVRTSLSSSAVNHRAGSFIKLTCDTGRNLSSSSSEYIDYTFYADNLPTFDVYDIKITLYSSNSNTYPIIDNYRSIILAT